MDYKVLVQILMVSPYREIILWPKDAWAEVKVGDELGQEGAPILRREKSLKPKVKENTRFKSWTSVEAGGETEANWFKFQWTYRHRKEKAKEFRENVQVLN